jgi:hypothetical protein
MLEAGEGVVDITPPLGVELAGFHKPPGQERVITGIRKRTAARALVLRAGQERAALVVLEVLGFSREFARRVQRGVARQTGIPAHHVRVSATHTHSAPSLMFLRQWGAVPETYKQLVEQRAVEAVVAAKNDLAPADLYLGQQHVTEGNHNRTSKTWKTDAEFNPNSTDGERWLDTLLHALYFQREKPKRSLLWYHFSAHPVCYTDQLAGPDWPGLVNSKSEERDGLAPVFLQGHCGDVNPGDGATSLGDPEKVSEAVWAALHHATNHSVLIPVDSIRVVTREFQVPLDVIRLQDQLDRYRKDPAGCTKGEWVDAGFAKAWFASASKWKKSRTTYATPLSAMRLGTLGLVFHSGELYGYYGLAIRRDSPFANTLVVGYTDDLIGYVPDPMAYEKGEYAAIVVPKIIDLPPFKPDVGRQLAAAALAELRRLA